MKTLDNFLDDYLKKEDNNQKKINKCCMNKENIVLSDNLLLYVCVECAMVQTEIYTKDFYENGKIPGCVKTYIPYQRNNHSIRRLHRWNNYSYKEVHMRKLVDEIDNKLKNIDFIDKEIKMFSIIKFKSLYDKISVRAKIKNALIVYCIYVISISLDRPIDLLLLLSIYNLNIKNYNDLVNKLKEDKLFYSRFIDIYFSKLDIEIDKINFVLKYNLILKYNNRKFNTKTILLGLLYNILLKEDKLDKIKFYNTYSISKNSIKSISKFIKQNNIIDNDINEPN